LRNWLDPQTDGGLDKCCYDHDECYEKNKVPTDCDMSKTDTDRKKCDNRLCSCLRRASPPCKYWATKWALLKAFTCNDDPSSILWWRY
jgi:hypothetical protein